jgi:hypothetical protein
VAGRVRIEAGLSPSIFRLLVPFLGTQGHPLSGFAARGLGPSVFIRSYTRVYGRGATLSPPNQRENARA